MDTRRVKKAATIFLALCFLLLGIFRITTLAQKRDDTQPAKPPSAPSSSSVPSQPNIPRPPSVPQLPNIPQTVTTPTLPSLPKLPAIPDTTGMPQTDIFSGEYSGVKTDDAGVRVAFIKNALGEKIEFMLIEDSKILKGDIPITIEEIKEGEAVVVHYEAKQEKDREKENIIKTIFVVVEETNSPKEEAAPEEKK